MTQKSRFNLQCTYNAKLDPYFESIFIISDLIKYQFPIISEKKWVTLLEASATSGFILQVYSLLTTKLYNPYPKKNYKVTWNKFLLKKCFHYNWKGYNLLFNNNCYIYKINIQM